MSQTRTIPTTGHQQADTDVVMKENAAAAALVDVAAGFVKKASDSANSSSAAGGLLPTNNASRKQWDREQACPPTDHGITNSTPASTTTTRGSGDETVTTSTPGTESVSVVPPVASNQDTPSTGGPPAPKYDYQPHTPSGLGSYHPTGSEHHPVGTAVTAATAATAATTAATNAHTPGPQPLSHPQVPQAVSNPQPLRPQPPPPPPPVPEGTHWPPPVGTVPPTHQHQHQHQHHPPPPPGYSHPSHHPSAHPPPPHPHHVAASQIHHPAHPAHPHHPHHHHHQHHLTAAGALPPHHGHPVHHVHPPHPHPHAHNGHQHQHHPAVGAPAPPLAQQHPLSAVLMSMSSIGFGVAPASSTDATEAVIRAVQDSMERSAVRLPTVASLRQSLTIHLKLGVPPKPSSSEPMNVDVSRLSLFLPQSVPLLPVEVVVGGLLIDHKEIEQSTMKPTGGSAVPSNSQQPTICTAVACVTLQQSAPETIEQSRASATPVAADTGGLPAGRLGVRTPQTTNGASPWAHVVDQQAAAAMASVPQPPLAPQPHQHHVSMPPLTGNVSVGRAMPAPAPAPTAATNPSTSVHRTNSMEVLAQISGEIRDRQINASKNNGGGAGGGEMTAALAMVCSSEAASLDRNTLSVDANSAAYSYKKLAPGVTPKGSKRLFVRHDYKDYSREQPREEEEFLVRSDSKTPNAAFPLKLHETLSQIEADGYGHIIGWLPHGRSFKIFQQQDFVDVVLPRYFVMTKKSSFLRQLNLYNFNRISVGPDSGSYYHEKFLKGLKFLCRRMSRQKVNGNGIRAAGNPDDEPSLANYPTCPPKPGGTNSCDSSTVSQNEDDDQDAESKDNGERPYSRLVGGPQSRPYSQAVRPLSLQPAGTATEKEATVGSDESTTQDGIGGIKKATLCLSRTDSSTFNAGSFPLKLQRILDKADAEGKNDIISWLPHGRAFLVRDVDRFVSEIMSQNFNQTKYSSFQRQLHMYNFQRITFGRDKGAYHHEKFERGRPDLCMTMVRTRVNGKGCRKPGDPDNEPDFYVDWEASEGSPRGGNESQSDKQVAMECVQGEAV